MNDLLYRGLLLPVAAAFILLLTEAHESILSVNWGYEGLTFFPPAPDHLWAIRFAAFVPVLWMPVSLTRPSQVAYWVMYIFVIVPSSLIPVYSRAVEPSEFITFAFVMTATFGLVGLIYRLPLHSIARLHVNPFAYWIALTIISTGTFAAIFSTFGFSFHVVGLDEVYGVRASYKSTLSQAGRLLPYMIIWQANVFDSLFLAYGLVTRKMWLVVAGAVGQLIIFSITGFKSVLFSGGVFVVILAATAHRGKRFGISALGGVTLTVGSITWANSLGISIPVVTNLLHRIIGLPGLLTGFYFDFFSHQEKAHLGSSIFAGLVEYHYDYDIPNVIGQVYFGSASISANANVWADAYANFGYEGMIAFALLLGAVMFLYDCVAQRHDIRLTGLMMAIPALSLSNSALLTCLLTHGVGMVVVVVFLLPTTGAPAAPVSRTTS